MGQGPLQGNILNSSMDFQIYFGDGEEKTTTCIEGNCPLQHYVTWAFFPIKCNPSTHV